MADASKMSHFDLKRAASFAAAGVGEHDAHLAAVAFTGTGAGTCSLCGKEHLKWLFALAFAKPTALAALGSIPTGIVRTEAVTFSPVGSDCIETWIAALPDSAIKLQLARRFAAEVSKERAAKVKAGIEAALVETGLTGETLLARFDALPKGVRHMLPTGQRQALWTTRWNVSAGRKGVRLWKTGSNVRACAKGLLAGEALAKPPTPPTGGEPVAPIAVEAAPAVTVAAVTGEAAVLVSELVASGVPVAPVAVTAPLVAPAPVAVTVAPVAVNMAADVADLLARGRAVYKDGIMRARLGATGEAALVDIGKKVKLGGKFISVAQRSYFAALVKRGETAPKVVKMAPAAVESDPANEAPVAAGSASGIEGARY